MHGDIFLFDRSHLLGVYSHHGSLARTLLLIIEIAIIISISSARGLVPLVQGRVLVLVLVLASRCCRKPARNVRPADFMLVILKGSQSVLSMRKWHSMRSGFAARVTCA